MARIFVTAEVLHTEDVLTRLGELRPQLYGASVPEQLAPALRPFEDFPTMLSIGTSSAAVSGRVGSRGALTRELPE